MKTSTLKKTMAVLIASFQILVMVPVTTAGNAPMEKRKLLVTAYYSPLPNQSFYIRGSLAADKRLNGRGTNGADGTVPVDAEARVEKTAHPNDLPPGGNSSTTATSSTIGPESASDEDLVRIEV